jgi:hydroxyacylglutathione hydrolase
MFVERSMSPQFLSNTYLVCDGAGGPAFFVDAGGPLGPLFEAVDRLEAEPTHVLLTHHHFDHVSELAALCERWPSISVLVHPSERELLGEAGQAASTRITTIDAGQTLRLGALEVCPLRTPGHTAGMLSFLVYEAGPEPSFGAGGHGAKSGHGPGGFAGGDAAVFTGDTLFRGSVGGVRAPGHTTYTDLRDSIMGTLMELPQQTVVYPGHTDRTTVGEEWEGNPFIRVWRGVDAEGDGACTALGEPATLILLAPDYDGGKKAWVRWPDGSDDILPGSRVQQG